MAGENNGYNETQFQNEGSVAGFNPNMVVPTGAVMRNPYDIAPGTIPSSFQFAAPPSLGKTEYLFEDGKTQQRGIGGRMIYGGGIGWMIGSAVGGGWGFFEGVRMINKDANASSKIKLNTVLNCMTKRGPYAGNTSAILGMSYGAVNSLIVDARGGQNDALNSVAAGAITGGVYNLANGVRGALLASGLGATVALGAAVAIAFYEGEVQPFQTVSDALSSGFSSGQTNTNNDY
eukprot:m.67047 g.67047  ORF g.67047 m.67047 type:complete len:233 (-) comp15966_c0_seq1:151-849(-)